MHFQNFLRIFCIFGFCKIAPKRMDFLLIFLHPVPHNMSIADFFSYLHQPSISTPSASNWQSKCWYNFTSLCHRMIKFNSVTQTARERKPLTDVQTNSHCNQKILTVTRNNLPDRLQLTRTSDPNDQWGLQYIRKTYSQKRARKSPILGILTDGMKEWRQRFGVFIKFFRELKMIKNGVIVRTVR